MTLPKERQASKRIEKKKLIQDIKQKYPNIGRVDWDKYDIDDLRKYLESQPTLEPDKNTERFYAAPPPSGMEVKTGGKIGYQYGGMADMSAAPMIKQPQRKKRKASGFRAKYSKGGGVRSSKYKL